MGNALPTYRQCSIQINNKSNNYVLCNPRVHIHSGRCEHTLPPTIGPSTGGQALFRKTPHTARGSVGVFTYDLYNESTKRDDKKMAVMFNNPYDFNLYSNCVAVGIFDKRQLCDSRLFDKMCHHTEPGFVRHKAGSDLTYDEDDVTISATMTDAYQPDLTITIRSSEA